MGTFVTAIILSKTPVDVTLTGIDTVNYVSQIDDHIAMNKARRAALRRVKTPYCFYLDSDDTLPDDYESVIDDCLRARVAVAYTDERIIVNGKEDVIRRPGEYSTAKHAANMYMLHHLVLYNTKLAQRIAGNLPAGGIELFEAMLAFELGKRSAAYIPRVGYNWHRGDGFHTKHDAIRAVCSAAIWCNRNMP